MLSRRPPSQRDPAYALHRLPGTVAQAAPGLKVKNAAPVRATTPNRKAAAMASTGAAILGYAEISISWGTVVSDDSAVGATSVSIDTSLGAPDLSVSSSTFFDVNTGLADSIYVAFGSLTVDPGLNNIASDLWRIEVSDPVFPEQRFLGSSMDTGLWTFEVSGLNHYPAGYTNTRTPSAVIKCSGGTNRQYAVSASLFVARFATPV